MRSFFCQRHQYTAIDAVFPVKTCLLTVGQTNGCHCRATNQSTNTLPMHLSRINNRDFENWALRGMMHR